LRWLQARMGGTSSPESRSIQEVTVHEPHWALVEALVQGRMSKKHLKHYGFAMKIHRLFRIIPGPILKQYEQTCASKGLTPRQLFHGTTPEAAEKIVVSGFSLPAQPGMFGKGLYFAKDPLKSVAFARRSALRPGSATAKAGSTPNYFLSFLPFVNASSEFVRHMLLCDVFLGRSRTLRRARRHLDPKKDLRPGISRCFGGTNYGSVRAPGGRFGAVHVTEFVVYEVHLAIPRFIIEFDQVRPNSVTANGAR